MSVVAAIRASLRGGLPEALAGGVSGCTMILVVLPLESIMAFQCGGDQDEKLSLVEVVARLYKLGGIGRFFKGPIPLVLTVFTEKFFFFFWYSVLKTLWEHAAALPAGGIAGGAMLLCGWAAENLAVPTRLPFETVYRDMQTSTTNEGGIATTRRIIKTEGFLGLYKGWNSILLFGFRSGIMQSCASPSLPPRKARFTPTDPASVRHRIFDLIKRVWLERRARLGIVTSLAPTELSFLTAFVIGAMGRQSHIPS